MASALTLQLDDQTARRLRERANQEGLSVEDEARRLLDRALRGWEPFWEKADRIRESLAGRALTDSADLIREDRGR
ncbi:MAG TPA: hypothetical protein VEG34_17575 [Thermoanaerobaculia bacterium]|nr:hypothetical protein [Thermoanaerobaculia bacterium]